LKGLQAAKSTQNWGNCNLNVARLIAVFPALRAAPQGLLVSVADPLR
jgi:hypothetical protein